MATGSYYPPVGFYFKVEFLGLAGVVEQDMYFQEVGGLSVDLTTEDLKAGGENRFTYKLPSRAQYPNLTLKRGLLIGSAVLDYIEETMTTMEVTPITLQVSLLNEEAQPLKSFSCVNAYPLKWSVDNFNAEESKVVVESMEWYYQYYKIL
ncbi:MAG: phage tail protein [Bacteroidota bacterium]